MAIRAPIRRRQNQPQENKLEEKTGKPAVKERPMLFSAPMVRALLDGSKTQTRRIVKPQPDYPIIIATDPHTNRYQIGEREPVTEAALLRKCPYGQPGDRIWGRETFSDVYGAGGDEDRRKKEVMYRANGETDPYVIGGYWTPSIHMPRWASRILLETVSVRVERLKDCSEADALAEGVAIDRSGCHFIDGANGRHVSPVGASAVEAFASLWESISGAGSWDANPWVWVIEFKRVTP